MTIKKTSIPITYWLLQGVGGKVVTAVIGTLVTAIVGGFIGAIASIGATNLTVQQHTKQIGSVEARIEQHLSDDTRTNLALFNYLSNIGGKLGLPPVDVTNIGGR